MRTRQPIVLDRIRAMLSHPGMMAALEQGRAITALQIIASTPPRNLTSLLDMLTALEPAFTAEDAHPDLMLVAPLFVSTVRQVDPRPATADRTNEMLDRVVDRARVLVAAEPADVDAATLNELALLVAGLDGAFARGELVDYPAPDFAFQWSSDDALPGRLSELKGRVVVLDFWATWCMPCVAAFPKVAELTEHYKDQPVTVLGVTHLQGTHIAGVGDETVTADDPELEYRLMGEYIDDKSITWPVVFSPEAAWLEYGVEAIPHIAIIGKDGRVRHRGLNPFMPAAEKQRLIDALLTEPYTPEG
ncbi:MAG: TlpA disulfide reductase family protein [Planctomycetota bacterium]